jgi:hypothetical protein
MSAFLKIDLLTDFAALCLTDFIDWRYIHSLVCIFDPACELLPPWTKELYLCTLAPLLYLLSSSSPLPPFPMYSICRQFVTVRGGGLLNCAVDHILQEFYTLFLTRFRTYKIATPPQTKITNKDDIKGFGSSKFLRLCSTLSGRILSACDDIGASSGRKCWVKCVFNCSARSANENSFCCIVDLPIFVPALLRHHCIVLKNLDPFT